MINPEFSYFKAPVQNLKPCTSVTLLRVYKGITGEFFKTQTLQLRTLKDQDAKKYKAVSFDYVTFSGIFTQRKIEGLREHSGLICLDFDHLGPEISQIKTWLINDTIFSPDLLFVSPGGNGLKAVHSIDLSQATHKTWFDAISNYYKATYVIQADKSGSDVSRACFLAWDPTAYINPKYLQP
jgi:hypothetical protein